ncbi:hypothetical protein MLD38_015583 [Melastoma candidum]|uniref:Uncharacterized protein n=1 Tax=Melastoma candidum TaxID=119954 RepID=A0ACB9RG76_9MYRT|nr:hypothetical protein MLD38_015583 [Melastoma candidum]
MADVVPPTVPDVPAKKPRNGRRKALKQTDEASLANVANINAQEVLDHSSEGVPAVYDASVEKENRGGGGSGHSNRKMGKSKGRKAAAAAKEGSMEELMEMMERLRIEKERTEEMLKEKDEILRMKEEEKESLRVELRRLQKLKEFKPNLAIPMVQFDKDQKQKKKGCPERKRPSPPYTLWCKDQWNEIKKENPDADFKEISNIVAAKWKNLSAEQKKPYEDSYRAEKEVYLKETAQDRREAEAMKLLGEEQKQKTAMELLQQYLQFKQDAEEDDKKKTKKEKDPLKPKQPMSAFFLYSNERRSDLIAESSILEVAKIAGEEWKGMNEKQRKPYEEMARQNKERYLKEMEAYKAMKEEEAEGNRREEEENMKLQKQEALQLLKRKEKTQNLIKKTKEEKQKSKKNKNKNDDPNKPKKPASSFLLFSMETRKALQEERPGVTNSTLNALISVKWKELKEEERGMWNARAAVAMETYKKEMEEYNNKQVVAASGNNSSK